MTDRMLSFRELLKPGTLFRLCHFLEQAFQESKAVIVREIEQGVRISDGGSGLRLYDGSNVKL